MAPRLLKIVEIFDQIRKNDPDARVVLFSKFLEFLDMESSSTSLEPKHEMLKSVEAHLILNCPATASAVMKDPRQEA